MKTKTKKKDKEIFVIEAIFDYMFLMCLELHEELFYNSLMIRYPKLVIRFPYKSAGNMFNIDVKSLKQNERDHLRWVINTLKRGDIFKSIAMLRNDGINEIGIDALKKELGKTANDFIRKQIRFAEVNIEDKESFFMVNNHFYMMEYIFQKLMPDTGGDTWSNFAVANIGDTKSQNLCLCIFLAQVLSRQYFELTGYWRAKNYNPGAEGMKARGEKNVQEVKNLLSRFGIKNTSVFRRNKELREKFFSEGRKVTDCTSEDRIIRIARSVLKGKTCLDR